jgi:hypothetical protein
MFELQLLCFWHPDVLVAHNFSHPSIICVACLLLSVRASGGGGVRANDGESARLVSLLRLNWISFGMCGRLPDLRRCADASSCGLAYRPVPPPLLSSKLTQLCSFLRAQEAARRLAKRLVQARAKGRHSDAMAVRGGHLFRRKGAKDHLKRTVGRETACADCLHLSHGACSGLHFPSNAATGFDVSCAGAATCWPAGAHFIQVI